MLYAIFLVGFAAGIAGLTTASAATEPTFDPGEMADEAPPELRHWGKLVGQWSTTEESLSPDGKSWVPAGSADWDFFWAFNGWGIQDNYTSPPLSQPLDDESTRQRGINLRIYNPDEEKWVLTWLTAKSTTPNNFTAVSDSHGVVMFSNVVDANGNYRRITFFDMTKNTFEWKLEWSKDQESWLEVYRIHGALKED